MIEWTRVIRLWTTVVVAIATIAAIALVIVVLPSTKRDEYISPPTAEETSSLLQIEFINATDNDVYLWVEGKCSGVVLPHTSALLNLSADDFGRDAKQPATHIVAIAETQQLIYVSGISVVFAESQCARVTFGALPSLATSVPTVEVREGDSIQVVRLDPLAQKRAILLRESEHVAQPRAMDTLSGAAWNDKPIRGLFTAVQIGAEAWAVNSVGMRLVELPQGTFQTGARGSGVRTVQLSYPFFMGVAEVTVAQYSLVLRGELPKERHEYPVVNVTWHDAIEFISRLSKIEGVAYNLPTEAQWEYGCQAGTFAPFDPKSRVYESTWFSLNSGNRVREVALLLPNAWGLHDMHGNVREWCRDWWSPAPPSGADPAGPRIGGERVSRGGAYDTPIEWCSCGFRDSRPPDLRTPWQGFRVVIEPFRAGAEPGVVD